MKKFIKPQAHIMSIEPTAIIAGSNPGDDPNFDPNKEVEQGGMESRSNQPTSTILSAEQLDF